jgi:hypothetical protein
MKITVLKAVPFSKVSMNVYLYFPHLLSDLGKIRDLHIMLFHENWHWEGHTFVTGINEITFACVL